MRNRAGVIAIDQISESQVGLGGQIALVQITGSNRVSEALRKLTRKCQGTTKGTVCNCGERIKNLRQAEMFESLTKESERAEKRPVAQMRHGEIWIKLESTLERGRIRYLVGLQVENPSRGDVRFSKCFIQRNSTVRG